MTKGILLGKRSHAEKMLSPRDARVEIEPHLSSPRGGRKLGQPVPLAGNFWPLGYTPSPPAPLLPSLSLVSAFFWAVRREGRVPQGSESGCRPLGRVMQRERFAVKPLVLHLKSADSPGATPLMGLTALS